MKPAIELSGQVFGRLTVLGRTGTDKAGQALWQCRCTCGRMYVVAGYRLRSGAAHSCGCVGAVTPRHARARFRPPSLPEIEEDRNRFRNADRAPLTLLSYARDFDVFRAWCAAAGRRSLPASADTVELYVVDLLRQGRKVTTLERHLVGIQHHHRAVGQKSPCTDSVRQLLAGAKRVLCQQANQKEALLAAEIRRIIDKIGRRTPTAARDTAILLFGFASALRRSNLARLNLEDLTFDENGVRVRITREKQDRKGEGRVAAVQSGRRASTCPVRALQDWLAFRGSEPGPLFCHVMHGKPVLKSLLPNRIGQIVQQAVGAIGLDRKKYGAHSLRAGLVTEALSNGAEQIAVARHTAHRSIETLNLYMRQRVPWKGHIGKFLDI